MSFHSVAVAGTDVVFRVPETLSVLLAAQRLGRSPIAVGCRGGGCGVCRIRVDEGTYTTKVMSRRHVTEEEQSSGIALACRTFPTSDLVITVLPPREPALQATHNHDTPRLAAASR